MESKTQPAVTQQWDTKTVVIRLPAHIARQLKAQARERGLTVSTIVRRALLAYGLDDHEEEEDVR